MTPPKSTRLSKLRMQSVLTNSQASDRRSGMTDFKDQVFLQLEEFKKKFMRLGFEMMSIFDWLVHLTKQVSTNFKTFISEKK